MFFGFLILFILLILSNFFFGTTSSALVRIAPVLPQSRDAFMPELPDIVVYVECLHRRVAGRTLERIRVAHPFLVRTFDPPLDALFGKTVRGLRRLGKRIVFEFDDELFLVLHLMIAGRLHWKPPGAKLAGKLGLAAFDFPDGTLTLTEAGTKRRASLHVVRGEAELARHNPGGLEVLDADATAFRACSGSTTTRSSAPSPTRISSAASATPTPTRFCIARSSRR